MFGFEVFLKELIVHCKAFEENFRATELAILPKIRPGTKHINVVLHHFSEYVFQGLIHILHASNNDHCADAWNKPLPKNILLKYRKMIFGL